VTTVHRNASARRRKPAERQSLELADELHGGGDICLGWPNSNSCSYGTHNGSINTCTVTFDKLEVLLTR
jgi:hypothetical protein